MIKLSKEEHSFLKQCAEEFYTAVPIQEEGEDYLVEASRPLKKFLSTISRFYRKNGLNSPELDSIKEKVAETKQIPETIDKITKQDFYEGYDPEAQQPDDSEPLPQSDGPKIDVEKEIIAMFPLTLFKNWGLAKYWTHWQEPILRAEAQIGNKHAYFSIGDINQANQKSSNFVPLFSWPKELGDYDFDCFEDQGYYNLSGSFTLAEMKQNALQWAPVIQAIGEASLNLKDRMFPKYVPPTLTEEEKLREQLEKIDQEIAYWESFEEVGDVSKEIAPLKKEYQRIRDVIQSKYGPVKERIIDAALANPIGIRNAAPEPFNCFPEAFQFSKRAGETLTPPQEMIDDIFNFVKSTYDAALHTVHNNIPTKEQIQELLEKNDEAVDGLETKTALKEWYSWENGNLIKHPPFGIKTFYRGKKINMDLVSGKTPYMVSSNDAPTPEWINDKQEAFFKKAQEIIENARYGFKYLKKPDFSIDTPPIKPPINIKKMFFCKAEPFYGEPYYVEVLIDSAIKTKRAVYKDAFPPHAIFQFGKLLLDVTTKNIYDVEIDELLRHVEHECVHILQRFLAHEKDRHFNAVGLTKKHLRTQTKPDKDTEHTHRETEFYSNLKEEERLIYNRLSKLPEDKRWDYFTIFTGIKDDIVTSNVFRSLRDVAPKKWLYAVKLLAQRLAPLLPQRTLQGKPKRPLIDFPKEEHNALWARLSRPAPIYTTRISKERGKYRLNQELMTPWGTPVKVTEIKHLQDVKNHPFFDELTKAERAKINQLRYEVIKLEPIREVKAQDFSISKRANNLIDAGKYFKLDNKPILLDKEVIDALLKAKQDLPEGYDFLLIHGYRTQEEQDETGEPGYPDSPMSHRSGKAVDLKLTLNDEEVDLGGQQNDERDRLVYKHNPTITKNRNMLKVLENHGFKNYENEWWHWGLALSKTAGQIYEDDKNAYDVNKLWELTKNNPVKDIPLDTLKHLLNEKVWPHSPQDVINNPKTYKYDMHRALSANLKLPILIYNNNIVDGNHRLLKSFITNQTTIKVKFPTPEQMKQALYLNHKTFTQYLIKILNEAKVPLSAVTIGGSGVLGALNKKQCNDLDVNINKDFFPQILNHPDAKVDEIRPNQLRAKFQTPQGEIEMFTGPWPVQDVDYMDNPPTTTIDELSYWDPQHTLKWKKHMNRPKDKKDIELLEKLQKADDHMDQILEDIGPQNEFFKLSGEALQLSYKLNNLPLNRMATELAELLTKIPYNSDKFYLVIAKAKELKTLMLSTQNAIKVTDEEEDYNEDVPENQVRLDISKRVDGKPGFQVEFQVYAYSDEDEPTVVPILKKMEQKALELIPHDNIFEKTTEQAKGSFFHVYNGTKLVALFYKHDHQRGIPLWGWTDTFYFDTIQEAKKLWAALKPMVPEIEKPNYSPSFDLASFLMKPALLDFPLSKRAQIEVIPRNQCPRDWANKIPSGNQGQWIASHDAPLLDLYNQNTKRIGKMLQAFNVFYDEGWNGSFHDAYYYPKVFAVGSSPSKAQKSLQKALEIINKLEKKDPAQARFEARQQVRPGD